MDCLRIEIADNGLILEYDDPDIRARNRSDDGPWEDPTRRHVFTDVASLTKVLTTVIPAVQADAQQRKNPTDFKSALVEAFKEADA